MDEIGVKAMTIESLFACCPIAIYHRADLLFKPQATKSLAEDQEGPGRSGRVPTAPRPTLPEGSTTWSAGRRTPTTSSSGLSWRNTALFGPGNGIVGVRRR